MTGARSPLRHNRDFRRLWAAQSVSAFGSLFGALALTALFYLHATPLQMGLLGLAQGLPVLLFAPVAGVWVDRLPRRRLLVAADLGRAVLLVTVPLAALLEALTMAQLYTVAFLTGALQLAFDLAYRAYLPALVGEAQILEGNAHLQASEAVAEVGAPAVGGALVQTLGAPLAVLVDGLTFLWSAVWLAAIRRQEATPPRRPGGSMTAEALEGLRALWSNPILRALTAAAGAVSFFGGFIGTLYGFFLLDSLGLSALAIGVTIGAGGAGSLVGAFLVAPATRRLGVGPALIAARCLHSAFALLIPLAGGAPELAFAMVLLAQAGGDPFWSVYEIASLSLRQSLTPDQLQGRVGAGMHLVQAGLAPLGALTGGLLAEVIGVRETLAVAAGGLALGVAPLVFSPIRGLRQAMPGEGTSRSATN